MMILAASFDTTKPHLWINRGLTYGDGLFETMRFHHGEIPLLDFHLIRLNKGLQTIKLDKFKRSHILKALSQLKNQSIYGNSSHSAVVKLLVFRGSQTRTYQPLTDDIDWLITVNELPNIQAQKPLKLAVSSLRISSQPLLAGMKHLSRLEQVMLANELSDHEGLDDLVVLDEKNKVIETTYQNLVMVKNNQLYSPELNNSGVNGVALEWLKSNFTVESCQITLENMAQFDGLMVCNSIRGFRWVELVEQKPKETISFGTSHLIHDKIYAQWNQIFKP